MDTCTIKVSNMSKVSMPTVKVLKRLINDTCTTKFCILWQGSIGTHVIWKLHSTGGVIMDTCNIKVCTGRHMPRGTCMIWNLYRMQGVNMRTYEVTICTLHHVFVGSWDGLNLVLCSLSHAFVSTAVSWILYRTPRLNRTRVRWFIVPSNTFIYGHMSNWKLFCIEHLNMHTCVRWKLVQRTTFAEKCNRRISRERDSRKCTLVSRNLVQALAYQRGYLPDEILYSI